MTDLSRRDLVSLLLIVMGTLLCVIGGAWLWGPWSLIADGVALMLVALLLIARSPSAATERGG